MVVRKGSIRFAKNFYRIQSEFSQELRAHYTEAPVTSVYYNFYFSGNIQDGAYMFHIRFQNICLFDFSRSGCEIFGIDQAFQFLNLFAI